MKKGPKKTSTKKKKFGIAPIKYSEIVKKEKLREMERIVKTLIRRDLEFSEVREKRERELVELDRTAKLLVRRDFELTEMRERQVRDLQEMDRIAKMLIRRDLELSEMREKREEIIEKLKERAQELEVSRTALVNILEDVDESRRKSEEEKNKTLAIITNLVDGLLVFDNENKLSLVNPRAEKFFDIKAKDITDRIIPELATFPTIKPLIDFLGKELKGFFRREFQAKENLVLEVSAIPTIREKEKLGVLVILHDITREKMIERMKTEFVSLAAHQLRTPLSAIKWTLRMLLDGDLGKINEDQRSFLEKTYSSNERMIDLINDLLNVTRIEEGRYLYKPAPTELEPVVEFVVNSYKEEIGRKNIKFEFRKPEKRLPQVLIDVEKIKLAVQNLLDNAVRYTRNGGQVTISLRSVEKKVEFSIQDTGLGIPEDQQNRVFTKFFRAVNVLRLEVEGTGLGLFITKNIIEAHGGEIWFESEEGRGTTFYFTLPAKPEFEELIRRF